MLFNLIKHNKYIESCKLLMNNNYNIIIIAMMIALISVIDIHSINYYYYCTIAMLYYNVIKCIV